MHYRQIWKNNFGDIPVDENGISYEIHHIDGNRQNNELSNLMCVSIREHFDIHFEQGDIFACVGISSRMYMNADQKIKLSEAVSKANSIHNAAKNKRRSEKLRKAIQPAIDAYKNSPNKTLKQIAKEYNCSLSMLRGVAHEQGVTRNKAHYMSSSNQNAQKYLQELNQTLTLTAKEASKIIGISSNSVAVYRRELGLKRNA